MSHYRLADAALRDLQAIAKDFAEISPTLSQQYEKRFAKRFELLAAYPLQCQVDPRLDGKMRVAIVRPYLILYLPTADGVEIARVLHGSRDLPETLGE